MNAREQMNERVTVIEGDRNGNLACAKDSAIGR